MAETMPRPRSAAPNAELRRSRVEKEHSERVEHFYKMFRQISDNAFLDYAMDERSKNAETRAEWAKGLYDFLIERIQDVTAEFKLTKEIESEGEKNYYPSALSLEEIGKMAEPIEYLARTIIDEANPSYTSEFKGFDFCVLKGLVLSLMRSANSLDRTDANLEESEVERIDAINNMSEKLEMIPYYKPNNARVMIKNPTSENFFDNNERIKFERAKSSSQW